MIQDISFISSSPIFNESIEKNFVEIKTYSSITTSYYFSPVFIPSSNRKNMIFTLDRSVCFL